METAGFKVETQQRNASNREKKIDTGIVQKINDKFAPFTVDMETASIAHVYNVNRIPFISIRCITDTDACRGMCNFEENCAKASRVAKNITVDLLNELRG